MSDIKQLDFPEFGQSLLGIGRCGIALLDTPLATRLGMALEAALPNSRLRQEQITTRDIEAYFQFNIADYGNLSSSLASNGPGCYPNPEDIHDAWEEWFSQTSEDVLLELFDYKRSASWDPFQSNDTPSADLIDDYFMTYAAADHHLSAAELANQLALHSDTLLCAVLLKPDLARTLNAFGFSASEDNISRIQADIHFLFGHGHDHQTAIYDVLVNRFDLLGLQGLEHSSATATR